MNASEVLSLNLTEATLNVSEVYSNVTTADYGNSTVTVEQSTVCTNAYCVSDDDYIDMIQEYIKPTELEWVLIFLYAVIFFMGLLGNFLVAFAVWNNHTLRTVTNYFLVNLAVADFMVLLFCLPLTVVDDVTETWFIGSLMCKIIKFLQSLSVHVSVLTLTANSMERWDAICHPLTFQSTPARTKVIILCTWVIAAAVATPELVVLKTEPLNSSAGNRTILLTSCKSTWAMQAVYQLCLAAFMYFVPFLLMFVFYYQMAHCLWKTPIPSDSSCQSIRSDCRFTTPVESQLQARKKAAKMLMAVVFIFGICYLPVHVLNILRYAGMMTHMDKWAGTLALISHWLCFFNSSINPVIYYHMSAKFRTEFKKCFSCCFRCFKKDPQFSYSFRSQSHCVGRSKGYVTTATTYT